MHPSEPQISSLEFRFDETLLSVRDVVQSTSQTRQSKEPQLAQSRDTFRQIQHHLIVNKISFKVRMKSDNHLFTTNRSS
jgi:hypothetical protein